MKKKDIHEESVRKIQSKMRSFFSAETKVKVYHGTTNSTRQQRFKKGNMVDVSALNNVIEVNTEERYVLAEPNVSMDDLVRETLRHGLLPKVVMEFPGITVGGGIQGGAGESSSFKYGLFHSTCLEYEIVLGDGTVVVCSPNVNQDLFYGTACSYGSLGVITLAKIALVDSKPFIKLTYTRTGDTSSFFKLLYNEIDRKVDYVDGIIFLNDHSVVMSGVFSELTSLPISTFTKRTDPWFYLHAKQMSQESLVYEELIPVEDYLFRYDRGAFWTGKYISDIFWFLPFSKFTRYLLDNYFHTRKMYRALQATGLSQQYIIQDISLPKETAQKFIEEITHTLKIFPLWICPLLPSATEKFSPSFLDTDMVINVGIWGGKRYKNFDEFYNVNRDIESRIELSGGRKVLYAHSYYAEDDFWRVYDKDDYLRLRRKYAAEITFPTIYEKITVKEIYKPSIVLGLLRAKMSAFLPVRQ